MGLKFRFILVASVALSVPAVAKDANYPKAEAQALDLAQKAIAIRSVRGGQPHGRCGKAVRRCVDCGRLERF